MRSGLSRAGSPHVDPSKTQSAACFLRPGYIFYHETYIGMSWFILPGIIFGVLCGAVIFTWLYNGSLGSVLMVAIWHALFDLLTASKAGQDILPILTTAGIIAFTLFIANINRPWGFRYQPKQIL